jgi:hypothetical protein
MKDKVSGRSVVGRVVAALPRISPRPERTVIHTYTIIRRLQLTYCTVERDKSDTSPGTYVRRDNNVAISTGH